MDASRQRFMKRAVAKPGGSSASGIAGSSYALNGAKQASRIMGTLSPCKEDVQVHTVASFMNSKCKLNTETQEKSILPENPDSTDFTFKRRCIRADLHPLMRPINGSVPSWPSLHRWAEGPVDGAGSMVNLSDRPSLCMSLMGSQAAIGSSDHAVYTVDIPTARFHKALYGRNQGHTEWVTCISHLPDGRILSGGMDSKLCLWDQMGARCTNLTAHMASISGVKAAQSGCLAVSSSYDKSIMLWDLSMSKGNKMNQRPLASLQGHRAPVMAFALGSVCTTNSMSIASGCRDGAIILWDACIGSMILHCKKAHTGHVTALECLSHGDDGGPDIFLSGGQDGALQVWDFRARGPVHRAVLHSSIKGQGALSCISVSAKSACGCPLIVTGGADKMMKVIDPTASFQVVHTLSDHRDFIYSLFTSGSLAWSGGGDGSLLVHDLVSGKCLYGLGASANGAVRCIGLAMVHKQEYLVCTGDDGNVMIYAQP